MNKKIAPTIIVIIMIVYVLVQVGVILFVFSKEGPGIFWGILIGLIPLGIVIALVAVYIERIKELREEEKDDLSKY